MKLFSAPLRLCLLFILILIVQRSVQASSSWTTKVDEAVLQKSATSPVEVLIRMKESADLSDSLMLRTKEAKSHFVYSQLKTVADQSQAPIQTILDAEKVNYKSYWISNIIFAEIDRPLLEILAQRDDIAFIHNNDPMQLEPIQPTRSSVASTGIEWGVSKINAPDAWALGITGNGIVVAGQDTGYMWDHDTLKEKYRGWNGSTADHNYNWHDAITSGVSNPCGCLLYTSPSPRDLSTSRMPSSA